VKSPFRNLGYKFLALFIALLLWGLSRSTVSVERAVDLPLEFTSVPADMVVTDQSTDAVNIRVRGSRGAVRSLIESNLSYPLDLSGARAGTLTREVDPVSQLALPRRVQVVSRSPSTLEVTLERLGTRTVSVKPDLTGEPAPGFVVKDVVVDPNRVRISGARSEVLRLTELMTETVDLTGARAPVERTVRPAVVGRHVWLDGRGEVRIRVEVAPENEVEAPEEQTG
jgi:YbbR domain-containing protein